MLKVLSRYLLMTLFFINGFAISSGSSEGAQDEIPTAAQLVVGLLVVDSSAADRDGDSSERPAWKQYLDRVTPYSQQFFYSYKTPEFQGTDREFETAARESFLLSDKILILLLKVREQDAWAGLPLNIRAEFIADVLLRISDQGVMLSLLTNAYPVSRRVNARNFQEVDLMIASIVKTLNTSYSAAAVPALQYLLSRNSDDGKAVSKQFVERYLETYLSPGKGSCQGILDGGTTRPSIGGAEWS